MPEEDDDNKNNNNNKGKTSIFLQAHNDIVKQKREAAKTTMKKLLIDFEKANDVRSNIIDEITALVESIGDDPKEVLKVLLAGDK